MVYQQIENLTIEPKISADAVDMHPAVGFAAVLFGAALFGAAGALVAVPISALLLSLVDIYSRQYELLPQLGADPRVDHGDVGPAGLSRRGLADWLRRRRPRPDEAPATHSGA